jgi:hypothetical protein
MILSNRATEAKLQMTGELRARKQTPSHPNDSPKNPCINAKIMNCFSSCPHAFDRIAPKQSFGGVGSDQAQPLRQLGGKQHHQSLSRCTVSPQRFFPPIFPDL